MKGNSVNNCAFFKVSNLLAVLAIVNACPRHIKPATSLLYKTNYLSNMLQLIFHAIIRP
jgi:hypothetical protein